MNNNTMITYERCTILPGNASFVKENSKLNSILRPPQNTPMKDLPTSYQPSLYHAYIKRSVQNAQRFRNIWNAHSVKDQ